MKGSGSVAFSPLIRENGSERERGGERLSSVRLSVERRPMARSRNDVDGGLSTMTLDDRSMRLSSRINDRTCFSVFPSSFSLSGKRRKSGSGFLFWGKLVVYIPSTLHYR